MRWKADILVHGDHLDEMYIQPNLAENYRPERNQVHRSVREYGDADAVLARCDHVTRVKVYTPQQIHTQLETHRCYSYYDDRGYLTILAPTQAADAMQEDVARSLGIDRRKLRVIKSQVGGGFGGKNIFSPYCWCALVTYLTGRPASLIFSREEAMVTIGSRHEYMLEAAVGTDRDGTMRAIDVTGFQNAGAYSEISEDVMETGIKNSYALFPGWMRCGSASIPCLPTRWRAVPFAASAQRRIASCSMWQPATLPMSCSWICQRSF